MGRAGIVAGAVCCLLICPVAAPGQDTQKEIELLKKEIDLLKRENDLLKKENDLLRKEIEQLKGSAGKKDGSGDAPSVTANGVTYVIDKVTRNGPKVTLQIMATNSKADCTVRFDQLDAVDADGNTYKMLVFDAKSMTLQVTLREGIKTRFDVVIPNVASKTTEFSRVDITFGKMKLNEPARDPLQFKNVRVGK